MLSSLLDFYDFKAAPETEALGGDYVELRAEMDVICVISNCPQINNPCNGFNPTPIRVTVREG